ncbi:MAG: YihY/virulence factor BrkB family protein [Vicinamibacterales bacterium]
MRQIVHAAGRGLKDFYDGEGMTHAAAIAYYSLLSLFPCFLLIFSVVGSLTANPAERDEVIRFVFRYFPRQFDFITSQLDALKASPLTVNVGGMLALTWASLGVFNAISSAVNVAWGVEKRRSFLKHRLVSFVMLLSAGAVLLLGLVLASVVKMAETVWFMALIAKTPWLMWVSGLTAYYAATFLLIGCVALVFYFIPNTKVRFREVWPGAIVVGLLWRVALGIFTWYASDLGGLSVVHGSIAAVVMFLLWIYVCAVILLYGVQMTASYVKLQKPLSSTDAQSSGLGAEPVPAPARGQSR